VCRTERGNRRLNNICSLWCPYQARRHFGRHKKTGMPGETSHLRPQRRPPPRRFLRACSTHWFVSGCSGTEWQAACTVGRLLEQDCADHVHQGGGPQQQLFTCASVPHNRVCGESREGQTRREFVTGNEVPRIVAPDKKKHKPCQRHRAGNWG
jgi:hypothetical protein